jgi:hypothetical protein
VPNTNLQANKIANEKIRPLAELFAGLYNECKSAQIEHGAEGWAALFPTTAGQGTEVLADGSDVDGRTPITNQDVTSFMTFVNSFLVSMEANSNAQRNNAFKIAVNPRRL